MSRNLFAFIFWIAGFFMFLTFSLESLLFLALFNDRVGAVLLRVLGEIYR
jgi:hypothetical protein